MIKLNKLARRGESNRYQVLVVSRQELGLANPHSSSNCDEVSGHLSFGYKLWRIVTVPRELLTAGWKRLIDHMLSYDSLMRINNFLVIARIFPF